MVNNNLAKLIVELLSTISVKVYYIDQVPPFDTVKNYDGFVVWDIDDIVPQENTEGLEYSNTYLILNCSLAITVYSKQLSTRNSLEKEVLDILYPKTSGKRRPLVGQAYTNGHVRYVRWINTTEFPVPKSAQSIPEMSASVLTFTSSFSIEE